MSFAKEVPANITTAGIKEAMATKQASSAQSGQDTDAIAISVPSTPPPSVASVYSQEQPPTPTQLLTHHKMHVESDLTSPHILPDTASSPHFPRSHLAAIPEKKSTLSLMSSYEGNEKNKATLQVGGAPERDLTSPCMLPDTAALQQSPSAAEEEVQDETSTDRVSSNGSKDSSNSNSISDCSTLQRQQQQSIDRIRVARRKSSLSSTSIGHTSSEIDLHILSSEDEGSREIPPMKSLLGSSSSAASHSSSDSNSPSTDESKDASVRQNSTSSSTDQKDAGSTDRPHPEKKRSFWSLFRTSQQMQELDDQNNPIQQQRRASDDTLVGDDGAVVDKGKEVMGKPAIKRVSIHPIADVIGFGRKSPNTETQKPETKQAVVEKSGEQSPKTRNDSTEPQAAPAPTTPPARKPIRKQTSFSTFALAMGSWKIPSRRNTVTGESQEASQAAAAAAAAATDSLGHAGHEDRVLAHPRNMHHRSKTMDTHAELAQAGAEIARDAIRFADARHVIKTATDIEQLRDLADSLESAFRQQVEKVSILHSKLETVDWHQHDLHDENKHLRGQLASLSEQIAALHAIVQTAHYPKSPQPQPLHPAGSPGVKSREQDPLQLACKCSAASPSDVKGTTLLGAHKIGNQLDISKAGDASHNASNDTATIFSANVLSPTIPAPLPVS